jgi:hypothetical protein
VQCPSCEFQNLPGSDSCGRCSTSLRLAGAATLDVQPPRASGRGATLRRIGIGLDRLARSINDSAARIAEQRLNWQAPPPGIVPRMIIPGWSQLHAGQLVRGWIYLASFVVFVILSIIYLGTDTGSIMLGMAFSVHSTAALDVLMQLTANPTMTTRIGWSIAISAALALLLYLPAIMLVLQVAAPRQITEFIDPLRPGDVVLVNTWRTPAVGQVVVYELPETRHEIVRRRGARMFYAYHGERIDRIIAKPGQKVVWENQSLSIDYRPTTLRPLRPDRLPPRLEVTVPADHYLILPTTTAMLFDDMPEELWTEMALIKKENILGTVYLQTRPFNRIGRIR